MTDVLNIFAIAREGLRRRQHDPSPEEVERYWNFARIWSDLDKTMQEKLNFITELVRQYQTFYQVKVTDSSYAILLPFSKVLETILSVPTQVNEEDLILQGAGLLKDAIDRQNIYTRPLMMDKSVDFATRQQQELEAIHRFVQTCVCDLFGTLYRGDRALLQENRNRLKSGAEFAYRWLALQEKNERDLASLS
jgi:CRISPR-associated protein Csc3